MIDNRDPEANALREEQLLRFSDAWMSDAIGDAAYIASLSGIGFRRNDAWGMLYALKQARIEKMLNLIS